MRWLRTAAHRPLRWPGNRRERDAFLARVRAFETPLAELSDEDLAMQAGALRESAGSDDWLTRDNVARAFALTREAAARTIGKRHYDEQLLAGIGLLQGAVVEMATGEGKTLAATLAAVVRALQYGSVHVMTVNPYLAQRDRQTMGPVYEALGISVGLLSPDDSPEDKRRAYAREITYGVGTEFGFDYLRDQLAIAAAKRKPGQHYRSLLRGTPTRVAETVQARRCCAIVDEADSVMIDEARTALILSGSSGRPAPNWQRYLLAAETVVTFERDVHYRIHRERNRLELLEASREAIDASSTRVSEPLQRPWIRYIEQALRARHLLVRDQHYVVQDDRIQIIDEFTGRRLEDRTWSDGLHQAVEALEQVTITEESDARLRISRQRFLGFYDHLSGMTGTANGCERELAKVFGLDVLQVPLRKPSCREVLATRCFGSLEVKTIAIVEEIEEAHRRGQPVLVGTRTVKASEQLSELLDRADLKHVVLNARQDHAEAEIISRAGERGRITIATNLAGRGADIPLEDGVASLGGLLVIAAEPNESARIDRQLAGRCARQGEPGAYRLYASAEDDLIDRHAPALARKMQSRVDASGRCLDNHGPAIRTAQDKLDRKYFEQRQAQYAQDRRLHGVLEKAG